MREGVADGEALHVGVTKAVTPYMGRGGCDIGEEGMRGWIAWGDRTNDAYVRTAEPRIH